MKIRILSDLHLEAAPYRYRDAGEDLVILAGDIADGTPMAQHNREALFANMRGKPVLYVLGNHEFHDRYEPMDAAIATIRAGLPPNVTLLNRESLDLGGIRFLGCPLWSDFRLGGIVRHGHTVERDRAMHAAALSIPDLNYLVDSRGEPIGPAGMAALHEADRCWLDNHIKQASAAQPAVPVVVVTHWLPSPESVAPQHVGSILTPYFASDCRDLIREPVRVWIHGHTHVPRQYKHPGSETLVVCNPRGTGPLGAQCEVGFEANLVVDVPLSRGKRGRRG